MFYQNLQLSLHLFSKINSLKSVTKKGFQIFKFSTIVFTHNISHGIYILCYARIQSAEGSVNQIPPWTEVQGDIRLTPFYDVTECLRKVEGYVADLNKGMYIYLITFVSSLLIVYKCLVWMLQLL